MAPLRFAADSTRMILLKARPTRLATARIVPRVFAALLFAALSSCSTQHLEISRKDNITADKIWTLRKGTTTKAEVESEFGAPMDRIVVKDGEKYFYKDFNLRAVYMEFDKNGVLVDFERTR